MWPNVTYFSLWMWPLCILHVSTSLIKMTAFRLHVPPQPSLLSLQVTLPSALVCVPFNARSAPTLRRSWPLSLYVSYVCMYVSKHIGLHLRLHVRIWILHRPHTPCCEAKPISKRRKGRILIYGLWMFWLLFVIIRGARLLHDNAKGFSRHPHLPCTIQTNLDQLQRTTTLLKPPRTHPDLWGMNVMNIESQHLMMMMMMMRML